MYLPPHFRVDEVARLHAAIVEFPFATIVTTGADGPVASHVPMLLDLDPAPLGTLLFHFARPNPQWRTYVTGTTALAMFLGPHAYVSPSFYPTKKETGKVVPTWNYLAVHARGTLETFDDPKRLRALVTRLTQAHETPRAEPWAVSDAPQDFIDGQLKGIVGLAMRIAALEGKWKLGQNRQGADRLGAIAELERSEQPGDRATAHAMREEHEREKHLKAK